MRKEKILVVDYDEDILHVVGLMLETRGYEAIMLNRTTNLLDKVKSIKPAVVLLDISLGNFDGRLLCKEIKEVEAHMQTKVILFSTNPAFNKDLDKYLCDDFIDKPFDIDLLLNKISHYADKN